uniref:Uncharacterized protein n=1 Tax=Setaria viridis TaxID=4556 RepID=A0A4U6TRC8_SETVI|nr:hypothetical protein SEVIR_7G011305v2 [Setaria viridis]
MVYELVANFFTIFLPFSVGQGTAIWGYSACHLLCHQNSLCNFDAVATICSLHTRIRSLYVSLIVTLNARATS